MKKLLLTITALLFAFSIMAQEKELETIPLEDIEKQWGTKTIDNVINGSIGIMLESFDMTWPTWMVGAVRETMEQGLDKAMLDPETGLTVTVDAKNDFVELKDDGTDAAYMSARVWDRKNGHRLLAIRLGKPTDPCLEFVCFYDYDAQQKTLTPEPDILKGYRWSDREAFTQIYYYLPKKGNELTADEWSDEGTLRHTFTWDGMKPVYAKTEPFDPDEYWNQPIYVNFEGANPNIKDFVTALLSGEEIGESLNSMKLSWELFLNGMNLMPGESITADTQNGYVCYESEETTESETVRLVIECCYWNYADKQHKLVALTNDLYIDGKPIFGQYTGIEFYVYDHATNSMKIAFGPDLGVDFDTPSDTDTITHSLPRQGKTMVIIAHTPSGRIEKHLTWNGSKFK